MKKQIKTTALAGAAVLALSGVAGAAVIDLNVYGASAQYLFWNSAAPTFLTSVRGCTATSQAATADGKNGITKGTGCDGTANNTINIRYSAKASYDGIRAVSNVDPANTCAGQPGQRPMITDVGNTALLCQDVHLGASDVAGESFTQQSHGLLWGPMGGVQTDRVFTGVPTTGLTAYQPVVVPFGFFANKNIQVSTCASGVHAGNLCTTNTSAADCGAVGLCSTGTISNITREQAIQIFSGNTYAWTDFGASYSVTGDATNTVVACFRHAGSGTHSTLDNAVMNTKWGGSLAINASTVAPIVYFNDGASDEMKCINNNANLTTPGAIGYADGDQDLTSFTNVAALKYNGLLPRRNMIRNGAYDFFSNQWLYENPAKTPATGADTTKHTLITQLNTFAGNPANIPTSKAPYWAAKSEMVWNKATDQTYPVYAFPTAPQTP
ncbi:type 2 periplasmic-binding domain-containing protein [Geobacter argillaceus]|uniref:PBP domain-containing protein n=1 Tax=Geobacter argillaceus TaxID=345631 RepID=A0A562VFK2_9BACT|nr:hypothetical protein [Geobacter argillaceus]TWJ16693.1 hypothetical protein JN12_03265 [Geobacter argillaceus]